MNDLFEAAAELQAFCDRQGWRSCFIGGLAVLRWGEPRVTRDIDLSLFAGFGAEDSFIVPLLTAYPARAHAPEEFARRYRVLLLRSTAGVGIDVSLGGLPFEELVVDRATPFSFQPGADVRTCSAEDLIVLKLFASRPIDLRDAEGVAIRQKGQLDWHYIEVQLRPLAEVKGEPGVLEAFAGLRRL